MGKIKINKTGNYTVIYNHVLQNKNLSIKAKGLYAFMWSLPPEWDYSVNGLVSVLKEGRDAITEALKELEREGYLVRSVLRSGGKFYDMDYTLNEYPDPFMDNSEKNTDKPKGKRTIKNYLSKSEIDSRIEESFTEDFLKNSFRDFLSMRVNIKKPITTAGALTRMINRLKKLSEDDESVADKILDQSIRNNWQDLYPLKDKSAEKVVSTVYDPAELARDESGNLKVF